MSMLGDRCSCGRTPEQGCPCREGPSDLDISPSAIDFDSDEPMPVCPLRNNGDEICESCQ